MHLLCVCAYRNVNVRARTLSLGHMFRIHGAAFPLLRRKYCREPNRMFYKMFFSLFFTYFRYTYTIRLKDDRRNHAESIRNPPHLQSLATSLRDILIYEISRLEFTIAQSEG